MRDQKELLQKVNKLAQELHRQAVAHKKQAAEMRRLAAAERKAAQSLLRESRGLRKAAADLRQGLNRERRETRSTSNGPSA